MRIADNIHYRTPQARAFHDALLPYLYNHNHREKLIRLTTACAQLDRDSILELSANGHTHLMDILHLSYQIKTRDFELIRDQICLYLMRMLLKRAGEVGVLGILLTQVNGYGFNPLHQALQAQSAGIIDAYLHEVNQAVIKGAMDVEAYRVLLTSSSNYKLRSPLAMAFQTRNAEIVQIYLENVCDAFSGDVDAYKQLFIKPHTLNGETALHLAACSDNFDIVDRLVGIMLNEIGFTGDEMTSALHQIAHGKYVPSCPNYSLNSPNYIEKDRVIINRYLDGLRKRYPKPVAPIDVSDLEPSVSAIGFLATHQLQRVSSGAKKSASSVSSHWRYQ